MAKKRKRQYDDDDSQEPKMAERIESLINSFGESYLPIAREQEAEEFYTIGRIREYFCAYPQFGQPDPLPAYLEALEERGFRLRTASDGTPAIFVKIRRDDVEI